MAKVTPIQVFPGVFSDGNGITIPLTNLPGVDTTETNATTGDIRPLVMGIVEQVFQQLSQLPNEDKPTDFTITKSNPTGVGLNKVRQTYSISVAYSYDTKATEFEPEPATENNDPQP